MMENQISIKKEFSEQRRRDLSELLKNKVSLWTDVEALSKSACVYTTGSFGRSDASIYSDLDVFVLTDVEEISGRRLLGNLQEIELLASIISANREMELPELDADGGFLRAHRLTDYLEGLGKPDDDKNNTFTGRILLLLESQPLFGNAIYRKVKEECIHRYWIDYSDHTDTFVPAFLLNDILRFWRTLCINYESGFEINGTLDPAKRRAKNYKLKYRRLMTCFSAVIGLQVQLSKTGTVTPEQALFISDQTPIERLEMVREAAPHCSSLVSDILLQYNVFLSEVNCSKEDLRKKMEDASFYRDSLHSARSFGDSVYMLMDKISDQQDIGSKGWRFLRYVTV